MAHHDVLNNAYFSICLCYRLSVSFSKYNILKWQIWHIFSFLFQHLSSDISAKTQPSLNPLGPSALLVTIVSVLVSLILPPVWLRPPVWLTDTIPISKTSVCLPQVAGPLPSQVNTVQKIHQGIQDNPMHVADLQFIQLETNRGLVGLPLPY